MSLDLTKPLTTRDGRPARIVATDAKRKDYPLVALVTSEEDREVVYNYTVDGRFISTRPKGDPHNADLINPPPPPVRKTRFLNLGQALTSLNYGRMEHSSTYKGWPVLEVTFEDDEVVESKVHTGTQYGVDEI
jgi:hypothetical protein